MNKAAAIILLLLLQAMPAFAEDYADWAKEHPKATPIWVLPKATAPSNFIGQCLTCRARTKPGSSTRQRYAPAVMPTYSASGRAR